MKKYRNRLQIVADILRTVQMRVTKTQIMYQANLSFKLLSRYLNNVLDAGLVSFHEGNCYVLTPKGEEFLRKYKEYIKCCKKLEKQLNGLDDKKVLLEEMFQQV